MLRLYGTTASPFVARVRIQMLAKSLPVELLPPPGGVGSQELRKLSALGRIPILQVGDQYIPESSVIQEYLEDTHPQPPLRGRSPLQAARVRLVARVVDLYLVPALQPLRAANTAEGRDGSASAQRGLEDALTALEAFVDGDVFAVGEDLSLADCAIAPLLFYVNRFAAALLPDFSLRSWPRLQTCATGMSIHPAVSAVLADMSTAVNRPRSPA